MMRRILAIVVALAAVVASALLGVRVPTQTTAEAPEQVITVTPARQDVTCPGPLVTPGGGGDDDELGGAASGVSSTTYTVGDRRVVGNGIASDGVVAATVERVGGGDISGLAAITCTAPLTDQWLVGGNTTVGDSARLVLTNPSAAAVEATVTMYGALGELEGVRVVPIGPRSAAELLLEGVEVNVSALAVHVVSTGNGVTAAMQHSRLDGFQPAGVDWVVAGAGAATELVIPGVGGRVGESTDPGDGTEPAAPPADGPPSDTTVVRLMAPEGATAQLELITPEDDAEWEGVAALVLEAGVAIDVPVPAVAQGAVTISATGPVVAGAVVTRVRPSDIGVEGSTAEEIRWLPSQAPGETSERAVLSVGYTQGVSVYSAEGGTFTLVDDSGETVVTAPLAPGATSWLSIRPAPGAMLTAQGPFAWTVLVSQRDFLTAMAPTRITIDDVDVTVRQQPYVPEP